MFSRRPPRFDTTVEPRHVSRCLNRSLSGGDVLGGDGFLRVLHKRRISGVSDAVKQHGEHQRGFCARRQPDAMPDDEAHPAALSHSSGEASLI